MNKIMEFLDKNPLAIKWTTIYFVAIYFIFLLLFGFNIFSIAQWNILSQSKLSGFGGFVFGILLLAAVPLYVATTTIILRTKKPIFDLFAKKTESKVAEKKSEPAPEPTIEIPNRLPTELHGAYLRAKRYASRIQESAYNKQYNETSDVGTNHIRPKTTSNTVSESENASPALPLPDDFSFNTSIESESDVPMFKDFSFDGDIDVGVDIISPTNDNDDIIIHNEFAVAIHDDSDFWIADADNWFANGKQKESPVARAIAHAATDGLRPAIVLKSRNIMDIDEKISEWTTMGVTIANDISELKIES